MAKADTQSITRRTLISGAATIGPAGALALPALPLPALAAATAHDAELLRLYEELRRAWVLERAIEHSGIHEEVDAAVARCSAVVGQIEQCVASTLEGLRVKAIAILWCHSGDMTLEFSHHQTTDIRLAQSIVRDLLP